ncbi:ADP-forming succinate--CoA ligase subunit beta [candidate division KSB3 bacterium]|uniref:Succinate--CoA ligase [ADP-forming] subunit beta n=1 Tax=candidate division KSB3 bacterium TaxID=2044937 RepID=A0A2G6K9E3_9BACT|nr:MAG: ADP-forming succinate--CoA ligase subunit beta [candidate division KSB3 bacterium]
MKIHEYQAKEIFARYQIPIPQETLCTDVNAVRESFQAFNRPVAVKAQVLVGGRGKAGGIKLAKTTQEAEAAANSILGMDIKGLTVEKVLVSEAVNIQSESYVGIVNDRSSKGIVIMVSSEGGVEIEEVAKHTPEKIFKLAINPEIGLLDFQARNLAFQLFGDMKLVAKTAGIIKNLYCCYVDNDASLAEINPLVETAAGSVLALDAKMNLDDNALYRHPDFEALRDPTEDEKKEIDAKSKGLSYIKLDGEIGCMVNGAGLAMATMDVIKLYGGSPANFLDIGGSSNPQKVVDAMNILLSDSNVKVVMINIFGGITRCDDVAKGLLTAMNQMDITVPIVVRLTGTNEKEGQDILKGRDDLITAISMREAAQKAIAVIR